MIIGGLQKLSLSDYPGRIAAVVFTQGCNLRCTYCHNRSLVEPALYGPALDESVVFGFLRERRGRLSGVVVSGGEPCVHPDLPEFAARVRDLGFDVKLDTNGTVPAVLRSLVAARLVDHVALDLKAPAGEYPRVTGADVRAENVSASVAILKDSGIPFEIRTTWAPSLFPVEGFVEMAPLLRSAPRFFLQPVRLPASTGGDPARLSVSREEVDAAVRFLSGLGVSVQVR